MRSHSSPSPRRLACCAAAKREKSVPYARAVPGSRMPAAVSASATKAPVSAGPEGGEGTGRAPRGGTELEDGAAPEAVPAPEDAGAVDGAVDPPAPVGAESDEDIAEE